MELATLICTACEGGIPPMTKAEAEEKLKEISGWTLDMTKISKLYKFKTFPEAVTFVDNIAAIAEKEGHHPDIFISYNKVTITLTTHAIGGLSLNDFIVAAKIDMLLGHK